MAMHTEAAVVTRNARRSGVPGWIADLLLQEGARTPARNGCLCLYFNAASRERILRRARRGEFQMSRLDHAWNVYAVVTRGTPVLVDVGHRTRRVRRK